MSRRARERRGHLKEYYANAPFPKIGAVRVSKYKRRQLEAYVHERDGHQCKNPNCQFVGAPWPASYLTIHHVQRLSQSGSDTKNNTITICMGCHDLIERRIISDDFAKKYLNKLYPQRK
jgi:5-methylcytosine-specific restriction endonuclease McrA